MRVGIADHLGWAVVVTASDDHEVVDRRQIELVEPGLSSAPIHSDRGRLGEADITALLATVRASISPTGSAALEELAELADARGWEVHVYDAKAVIDQAARMLAGRAETVLHGPRAALGPPWTKDHRMALDAAIVAGDGAPGALPGHCRSGLRKRREVALDPPVPPES